MTIREAPTEWLTERAALLRRNPGSDFQVRGVSGAEMGRGELRAIERELERREIREAGTRAMLADWLR